MRLQPAGGALPRLGLRPLAADLHPVGQLVQLGGKGASWPGMSIFWGQTAAQAPQPRQA